MFTEDLTAFLSAAEFSVPATLPGGAVVQVIFDAPHEGALGMDALQPSALGRSADLDALAQYTSVSIGGQGYKVGSVQPDGTGLTRLILERAA